MGSGLVLLPVTIDTQLVRELLRELVAIDSVNPSLVPGARGEAEVAKFLLDFLRQRGIEAELQEAACSTRPDGRGPRSLRAPSGQRELAAGPQTQMSRPNVVALIGPKTAVSGPKQKPHAGLAVLAHIDTVGAGDMRDPFTPRENQGRLYGRGALDIKSGVAAMSAAALAVVDESAALRHPLLLAAVVDEESNSIGTEALLSEYSAETAVVLEPTDLRLVVAHKGYAWFEITTHGRAAHGSLPAEGRDAIRMMGRVLNLLDALDRKLAQLPPHERLGRSSLHASLIRGGQELSSYPAECRLAIERRTLPDESDAEVEAELRTLLEGLEARDAEFRGTLRCLGSRPPFEISPEAPIAAAMAEAIREATGAVELSGMAAWTDTALLAAAGIPGVVFGPRGQGLHGTEEYVEMESVYACAEVLRRLILRFCAA
ncbi:MAG TPA: M20/M25/M40 family metallo-hydrolase [Candidatus Acidoferrales bacterium]|nr:M20/M25/M40 family metallo-hydrolase [Candidatus Acidoferrales bacterium]